MKKRITALLLCLVMVFSLIPTTVWAASNSTVVLHPSVNNTVTGVKVKVNEYDRWLFHYEDQRLRHHR